MRPMLEGVAAQTSEPSSKMLIELMKTHFLENVE
jgi:hypothetical protein